MTFSGSILQGNMVWSNPHMVAAHVASLEGKRVAVTIEKWRENRSSAQNRYLHGVVFKLISDHTGYELEETKEICKALFLSAEKDGYRYSRSTASLNTAEMAEFIERIQRWSAQEMGVVIPDPGEC